MNAPPVSPSFQLSENPLEQAQRALRRIRKTARICASFPLPLVAAATAGGWYMIQGNWLQDRFLFFFLALIYGIFVFGQLLALAQIRRLLPGVAGTEKVIEVLRAAGDEPDLEALRQTLLEHTSGGHLRDLLLRWIELGLRGEVEGSDALLDSAWERRSLGDSRALSWHISLNRTTLKLGFLGTLIGLILTFPPMKRAVLGLSDSQGEFKFIADIAKAIDGDQYAILNTLIATALSIFIEFVTVQLLERVLNGFDMVNSHINDWNLTRLQPWIRKHYGAEAQLHALEDRREKMEHSLMHAQQAIETHLSKLTEALRNSATQLDQIARIQAQVGKRVGELGDYEKQYRTFLAAKQQAAAPPAPGEA